jgi:hypothetical protein
MTSTRDISKFDDVIDSRDVIARIRELRDEIEAAEISEDNGAEAKHDDEGNVVVRMATCGDCGLSWNDALVTSRTPTPSGRCPYEPIHDEIAELKTLEALEDEAEGYASDWSHGVTLIRDSCFTKYAQQFAEDIGAVNADASWPNAWIDWEEAARELQQDYKSVDFDGVDYWVR